ncbi:hypothetical protein [Epilithonimonas caeni]|uniref:hypothetical protein n=1 Tax=Epilithonimonas caeni TaxID=365343 RepID=UPI0004123F7B|nr:hypothetical protein [Epilithonimonas caeni]
MRIEDLPENFTPEEFMKLDKMELDNLPYDVLKWECCFKNCNRGTTIRDYGIGPFYFLNRNSKAAEKHPERYWNNLNHIVWFCGKHYPYFKRLGWQQIEHRYFERKELSINPIKKVNQGNEKLG